MGWRFRKTFKLFAGVHIHLSKTRGITLSLGRPGASINIGLMDNKASASVGIPGSGLSYRTQIHGTQTGRISSKVPAEAAKPSRNTVQEFAHPLTLPEIAALPPGTNVFRRRRRG